MNWKLEIENWKLARRGFTIVELLVAMALLVILLGLSGMVFHTTVQAHRAAGATIDVTRNLRAITDQLSADLRGLRKDAPLTIWFEQQWLDANADTIKDADELTRFDQIQFFADGDFQSTKQYAGQTVYGNVARVYYGHAWLVDSMLNPIKGYFSLDLTGDGIADDASNMLCRRLNILTNDAALVPFPSVDLAINELTAFPAGGNNHFEYDNLVSLSLWKQLLTNQTNCNLYLDTCFNNSPPAASVVAGRPVVYMQNANYLFVLLSQGVIQMQVQWAYTVGDLTKTPGLSDPVLPTDMSYFSGVRWWPSVDPAGDLSVPSDFATMTKDQFGVYFEMPGGTTNLDWYRVKPALGETPAQMALQRCRTQIGLFRQDFYPRAMKFTFTLTDSNGIFADGKTFTHIVYLDN